MAEFVRGERVEHEERIVRPAAELRIAVRHHGHHGVVVGQQPAEVHAYVLGRHVAQLGALFLVVHLETVVRHEPVERQFGKFVHDVGARVRLVGGRAVDGGRAVGGCAVGGCADDGGLADDGGRGDRDGEHRERDAGRAKYNMSRHRGRR